MDNKKEKISEIVIRRLTDYLRCLKHAQKAGEKIYVQVAYMLTNKNTIDREFGNLLDIHDNYPKYVVTMDEITETSSYKGIKHMHVKDFCLKQL